MHSRAGNALHRGTRQAVCSRKCRIGATPSAHVRCGDTELRIANVNVSPGRSLRFYAPCASVDKYSRPHVSNAFCARAIEWPRRASQMGAPHANAAHQQNRRTACRSRSQNQPGHGRAQLARLEQSGQSRPHLERRPKPTPYRADALCVRSIEWPRRACSMSAPHATQPISRTSPNRMPLAKPAPIGPRPSAVPRL